MARFLPRIDKKTHTHMRVQTQPHTHLHILHCTLAKSSNSQLVASTWDILNFKFYRIINDTSEKPCSGSREIVRVGEN